MLCVVVQKNPLWMFNPGVVIDASMTGVGVVGAAKIAAYRPKAASLAKDGVFTELLDATRNRESSGGF